jgi:DNA-directed RNA polymerase subunit H (RpoH/RPB5)
MSDPRKVLSLLKSRITILQLLSSLEYNTSDYEKFVANEVDAMYKHDQLDMMITHLNKDKKVFIKFYVPDRQKQIPKKILDETIEDLFTDKVLTTNDCLIIIMDDEPNDSNIAKMNYLYDHEGIFIVMHNIKRLQFNITEHFLVPKMTIIADSQDERDKFFKTMKITSLSQLPEISRYDPQALALCLRPKQICKIERTSVSALNCEYFRVCV